MGNAGVVNVGYLIEDGFLVELQVGITGAVSMPVAIVYMLHPFMPGKVVFLGHKAPSHPSGQVLQPRVDQCRPAAALESCMKIADGIELVIDPAHAYLFLKMPQRAGRKIAMLKRADDRFGRKHPAFHSRVNSFYPLSVQKRSTVTDQQNSVGIEPRHRVVTAGVDRLGTVLQHLAALKGLGYLWMRFEFLKFGVRVDGRIKIVQAGHVTDADYVVLQAIDPTAAVGLSIRRKTKRV